MAFTPHVHAQSEKSEDTEENFDSDHEDVIHFRETLLYKRYNEAYSGLYKYIQYIHSLTEDPKKFSEIKYYWNIMVSLFMMFFGGHYSLCIAAHEAFLKAGYSTIHQPLYQLWNEYKECGYTFKGFMDRSDPVVIWDTMSGVGAGCMAVLATLKLDFVHATALGIAFGDKLGHYIQPYNINILNALNSEKLKDKRKRWVPIIHKCFFRVAGFLFSLWMYKLVYAIRCGAKGVEIMKNQFCKSGVIGSDGPLSSYALHILLCIGIYTQYTYSYVVPFPINVILFPLEIMETILEGMCLYK